MKKVILLLLLAAAQLGAQASSKPNSLVLITDQITMGMSEQEFLSLLSETVEVDAKEEPDFTDLCRYEYTRQILKDMVRYNAATQQYLADPAVTRVYVAENPAALWPRRQRVMFFFYKEYGSPEPFTLFAIHAVHRVEVGDMNSLFEKRLPGASANRPDKKPLLLSTSYYLNSGERVSARMAVWNMDAGRDILFVPDNGQLIFTEFFFVDNAGFDRWKEASRHYMEAQKSKQP